MEKMEMPAPGVETVIRARAVLGLVGWLALTFMVAWFGAQFTTGPWYEALRKPSFSPPPWVFGPVWTVLYILMAVAAWMVWKPAGISAARGPLALYLLQLVLNGAWSWLFFGLRRPDLAMVDIVLLWLAIVATALAFRRRVPLAGYLLLPYLAWVSFASVLNFAIWRLNS